MTSPQSAVQDPISLLLEGRYPDPQSGEALGVPVHTVVIEDSLDGAEADLVSALGFGRNLAVVSDPETHAALGARVERALDSRFRVQSVKLPSRPHPDEQTLRQLSESLDPATEAVIAVGSGTINDLCKMVAHRRGCPQAVFGTAPSMNGYTSGNAAITVAGHKKTLPAVAPSGVFLDLGVLAAAPKRLIRSGLGDSICRTTAQADWLLAQMVVGDFETGGGLPHVEPYREAPFTILAADEGPLFSHARALLSGDLVAMRRLARTLVLSGFGMAICHGSYPASQGEHLLSHYVEMMAEGQVPDTFHGEQIGVTALAMARLQDEILGRDRPPTLRPTRVTREDVVAHFGPELGASCWKEFEPKRLDAARVERLNASLALRWDEIRARIRAVSLGADTLEAVLAAAGAPTRPADLGWSEKIWNNARTHAREIRNRYTFLDFAAELA